MTFQRPDLSTILRRVATDMEVIGGVPADQYNAVAEGIKQAIAGASHTLHGHIDWASVQFHPYTATGKEFEQHAAVFGVARLPATAAGGTVRFTGTTGKVIPAGTLLHSRYGYDYVTGAEATIAAGTADVSVVALLAGVAGNLPATETLSLVSPVDGVKATATLLGDGLTGGNDIEGYDTMRVRYLREVQEPVKGGTRLDYVTWALSFPGVTRAWAKSLAMGDGTVTVRFAMDNKYADGIPLAADATALYNYLEPLRPAGMSGLTVVPPTPAPLNPTIAIAPNTTAVQAAIEAQLRELLRDEAEPEEGTGKGRVLISHLRAVTSQAAGEADNAWVGPTVDVTPAVGSIVTLGTITWQTKA